MQILRRPIQKEFEAILEERDVIRKLNELETLNAEAEARRREAPPDAPDPVPYSFFPPFPSPFLFT